MTIALTCFISSNANDQETINFKNIISRNTFSQVRHILKYKLLVYVASLEK